MPDPVAKVAISRVDRRPTRGWDVDKTRAARACLSCRARKVKCTGELPACKKCTESGKPCVYRQRQNARLRTAPEQDRHVRALMGSLRDRITEDDGRQPEDFLGEVDSSRTRLQLRSKKLTWCKIPNSQVTSCVEPSLSAAEHEHESGAGDDAGDAHQVDQPPEALTNDVDVAFTNITSTLAGIQDGTDIARDNTSVFEELNDALPPIDSGPNWSGPSSSTAADGPERVQMDNSTLIQLFWYLQTNSGKDARKFLDCVGPLGSGRPGGRGERAALTIPHSQPLPKVPANNMGVFGAMPRVPQSSAPLLPSVPAVQNFARETTIATIKLAVDIFFKSSCLLFYIIPKEQIETILMGDLQQPDETPFVEVLSTCSTLEARARLAELCGMAAVGLLYLRESDDQTNPPARLGDYFYNMTKQLLDSAIEANPFRAMKVCALLCMYNIYIHAQVAVAFVEFGLGLAKTFALTQQYPSKLSLEEYLDYRRTWRTLLCFSGWLAASLGYAPGQASSTLYLLHNESEGRDEDVIQRELVKVTIIKAKMLRAISNGDPLEDHTIEAFRQELKLLEASLPPWMRVTSLLNGRTNFPQSRTAMYFHLFFLSAMQLLHRLPMANSLQLSLLPVRQTAQAAMKEGLMAAELAARLLNLMRLEGLVVKICWMCIYCAYSTGTILLHKTAQKVIHSQPPSSWTNDLNLAKICVDTLAFCGQKDKVAAGLQLTLSKYLDVIGATANEDLGVRLELSEGAEDIAANYLLSVPLGDTALHKAARDLLRLTQYPFDTNLELLPQGGQQAPHLREISVNVVREVVEIPQEWHFELDTCGLASDIGGTAGGCDLQVRNVIQEIDPGSFINVGNANPWPLWTPQEV
ncbi:hypothetical protein BDV96DRAFT_213376 [Lophiotrema nucula]|uniref:Zn(2)-C6 fungal-type domain-containing protein n=1 Tax=Lophiotrema nucula TaxID=690887 RepID=A0A6A5ZP75_9PLEO|nr:hypothetical protein BDV96DRAFT_213376 [Lophiotrema nucula]